MGKSLGTTELESLMILFDRGVHSLISVSHSPCRPTCGLNDGMTFDLWPFAAVTSKVHFIAGSWEREVICGSVYRLVSSQRWQHCHSTADGR